MGPIPERPARSPSQFSFAVSPTAETSPIPVTTPRRRPREWRRSSRAVTRISGRLRVRLDVGDGVLDLLDLLGVLVGDLDAEGFLEGHHELHGVERVGAEVVDEARLGLDLLGLDPELLDDDALDLVLNRVRHSFLR